MTTKFGVLLTQTCSWEELAQHTRTFGPIGFDGLWVADQIASVFLRDPDDLKAFFARYATGLEGFGRQRRW